MNMYECKVFDEMLMQTTMHIRYLMKCLSY